MITRVSIGIIALLTVVGCAEGHCRRKVDAPAAAVPVEGSPTEAAAAAAPAKPGPNDRVMVYKYDGSLQCQMGKAVSLKEMAKELNGIPVISSEKKRDGLMHIQVCGSITGMANVFEIPAKFLKQAEAKGFKKVERGVKPALPLNELQKFIRDVPDFPKPGILFKDITPLLSDAKAFDAMAEHLAQLVPKGTTKLVSIESRGFILGSAVAMKLGLGMVLIRKPGKLPYATLSHSYALEYGKDTLQIHVDALGGAERVCIIDDVLATGGTAGAAEVLCAETGAVIHGLVFLMELGFLGGRKKLKAPVHSLISL